MYRMYPCWGSKSRSRYRGTAHSSALGEERVGVIDCGPSLGDYIIPDTSMYQVPGIFFVTVVYIAKNLYTQYVPGTALGGYMCRM